MKEITLLFSLLFLSLLTPSLFAKGDIFNNTAPKDSLSFCISPTDSGEVFNSKLTKSELIKLFGKANVGEKSEWFEEGTVEKK